MTPQEAVTYALAAVLAAFALVILAVAITIFRGSWEDS